MGQNAEALVFEEGSLENKDIWRVEELGFYKNNFNTHKTINFSKIKHPWLKAVTKKLVFFLLKNNSSVSNALSKIGTMVYVGTFMIKQNYYDLSEFNHRDTRKYIAYLNSMRSSAWFLIRHLSNLNVLLTWGAIYDSDEFPDHPVILPEDRPKKVKKEPKFYTENEIEKIKSILPFVDPIVARITLIMIHCGLRFADVVQTPIVVANHSCITMTEDQGVYVYEYYMPKVQRYNRIPVQELIAKVILTQIRKSKEKFGDDCVYVFARSKTEPLSISTYYSKLKSVIRSHNVLNDSGEPFRFSTRMFRSTFATKLLNSGVSPDTVRTMLGHKNVYTQNHYAAIHSKMMVEMLAPMIEQDNLLIANIGHTDLSMHIVPDDFTDFVPLPNGSCTCAADCPHLNACYTCNFYVPSAEFLSTYKLQLEQAELAIAQAKKYGHEKFMNKNITLKEALTGIIRKLEEDEVEDIYETGQDVSISEIKKPGNGKRNVQCN